MAIKVPFMFSKIPKVVFLLGLVSFFTDVSSEMIYPLLPIFLSTTLGASTFHLGLIEGIAEATASFTKVMSGIWSDRVRRKKPLIVAGYTISGLFRPLIGLATSWPTVLGIRFFDRMGKGLRTSPRDALIADSIQVENRGRAYGFHRSMDHAGAVTGPIVASLLLLIPGVEMRDVFLLAIVPSIIVVLILVFFLKETAKDTDLLPKEKLNLFKDWKKLGKKFRIFLAILFVFTLGNSADAFLLVRLNQAGVAQSWIAMLWAAHHVVKMVSSYYGGILSDKIGRKRAIILGWVLFSMIYLAFAFVESKEILIGVFLAYGVYFGLTEPSEKALVADIAPVHLRGTGFGYFNFVIGVGILPASILFGLIWDKINYQSAFIFGAGLALISSIFLYFFKLPRNETTGP